MAYFPKVHTTQRAPRTQISHPEPTRFRIGDHLVTGNLQRISLTGGCALFNRDINSGTLAEIAIATKFGPVCGLVEFLAGRRATLTSQEHGFRFVALSDDDFERLGKVLEAMN
jgi:hypothetical protein